MELSPPVLQGGGQPQAPCQARGGPVQGSPPHTGGICGTWVKARVCKSSEEPSLSLLALQRKHHFSVALQSQDHKTCASPQLIMQSFLSLSVSPGCKATPPCCFTFKQRNISGSAWLLKYSTSSTKLWYSNFCMRKFSVWSPDAVNC